MTAGLSALLPTDSWIMNRRWENIIMLGFKELPEKLFTCTHWRVDFFFPRSVSLRFSLQTSVKYWRDFEWVDVCITCVRLFASSINVAYLIGSLWLFDHCDSLIYSDFLVHVIVLNMKIYFLCSCLYTVYILMPFENRSYFVWTYPSYLFFIYILMYSCQYNIYISVCPSVCLLKCLNCVYLSVGI